MRNPSKLLILARAYGMRAVALRFFNSYGPFQALSNSYTGVLTNFAPRVNGCHVTIIDSLSCDGVERNADRLLATHGNRSTRRLQTLGMQAELKLQSSL